MSCPINYPDVAEVLPCFSEIIAAIRSGNVFAEKAHVIKHAYAILGAGLKVAFGDPDVPPVIGAKAVPWALLVQLALSLISRLVKEDSVVSAVNPQEFDEIANTFEMALAA